VGPESKWYAVGCAQAKAWVSRSGKAGAGVSLQLQSADPGCRAQVVEAWLRLPSQDVAAEPLPPAITPGARPVQLYLPFLFDNEGSWNRGERSAELVVRLEAGPVRQELRLPLRHQVTSILSEPRLTARPEGLAVDPITRDDVQPLEEGRRRIGVDAATSTAVDAATTTQDPEGDADPVEVAP